MSIHSQEHLEMFSIFKSKYLSAYFWNFKYWVDYLKKL